MFPAAPPLVDSTIVKPQSHSQLESQKKKNSSRKKKIKFVTCNNFAPL